MIFRSLVSTRDLTIRYPNGWELISSLPTSQAQCFRPEAELLLQKFFSLKSENISQFIANVLKKARDAELVYS